MKKLSLILLFICFAEVNAASFDCTKASSLSEITICNDDELSKLDESLSKIYKKAKNISTDKKKFKEQSIAIWNWREKNCFSKDCLLSWYKQRLISLNKIITNNRKKEWIEAVIFDPISNIRNRPHGDILCKIKKVKIIKVKKINEDWYSTNTCGKPGAVHKSQLHLSKKSVNKIKNTSEPEANTVVPSKLATDLINMPIEGLIRLAEKKINPITEVIIGYKYENGIDVKKDKKEAFKWYLKAAKNGSAIAQLQVVNFYKDKLDIANVKKWLKVYIDNPEAESEKIDFAKEALKILQ